MLKRVASDWPLRCSRLGVRNSGTGSLMIGISLEFDEIIELASKSPRFRLEGVLGGDGPRTFIGLPVPN
jgi:hypothetical protein